MLLASVLFLAAYAAIFAHANIIERRGKVPGTILSQKGASKHFPVVIVPGITSTNLENWTPPSDIDDKGAGCFKFREKVWGDIKVAGKVLTEKQCWLEYLLLGPDGLDPIYNNRTRKLRPPKGLSAAEYFVQGYWIWAKVIKNLAAVGYDINDITMAAYDWRLGFPNLEVRDHYLSQLKMQIEVLKRSTGKKVVIISHSLGGNIMQYFLKHAESQDPEWVNENIEATISIGAPTLGVPKAIPSILSGEMLETARLNMPLVKDLLETTLGREERQQLFRSWDSVSAMIPKGGSKIWPGPMITISRDEEEAARILNNCSLPLSNLTTSEAITLLNCVGGKAYSERTNKFYSYGISNSPANLTDPKYWSNPLETALPNAPEMRIYSFYGVGIIAERAYFYKTKKSQLVLDNKEDNQARNVSNGVQITKGDGTVPLVSLGFMSFSGWKHRINESYPAYATYGHIYNPYRVQTITREYWHSPVPKLKDLRGGPSAADHVNILGNGELMLDILRIVCNFEVQKVSERIYSDLVDLVSGINLEQL